MILLWYMPILPATDSFEENGGNLRIGVHLEEPCTYAAEAVIPYLISVFPTADPDVFWEFEEIALRAQFCVPFLPLIENSVDGSIAREVVGNKSLLVYVKVFHCTCVQAVQLIW
jgi:hypothetical protein